MYMLIVLYSYSITYNKVSLREIGKTAFIESYLNGQLRKRYAKNFQKIG